MNRPANRWDRSVWKKEKSTHEPVFPSTAPSGRWRSPSAWLAGCTEPGPRPLVFAVGGAPAELAVWEELARDFGRQHGLAVELLRQPSDTDQRRQALVVALAAGRADPDVFLMDVAWLGLFAASGWLATLDGEVDTTVFFEEIVTRADTHRGRLVALPVYVDGGVLYARKDLLEAFGIPRLPLTWEELRAQAAFVQQRMRATMPDFYGFVWQGAQYEGLICNFLEFAGSRGGFVEAAGRVRLDTPENRAAVGFMRGLIRDSGSFPAEHLHGDEGGGNPRFFPGRKGPLRAQLALCLAAASAGGFPRSRENPDRSPAAARKRRPGLHVGRLAHRRLPVLGCQSGGHGVRTLCRRP